MNWRRHAAHAGLALASLLVSLAAVEVTLRWTEPIPWYERIIEDQTRQKVPRIQIGDHRFPLRSGNFETPKPPGVFRILFLGDSFTYGRGLQSSSDTFVTLTTARLNERQPLGPSWAFEAFNGGMPGSYPSDWVRLSDAILDRYQPDLVVTVFFLRDAVGGITTGGQIRLIREGMRRLSQDSLLFRFSRLYRLYEQRRSQTELSRRYLGQLRDGYVGEGNQTSTWQIVQNQLLKIRRDARRAGAEFILVIFPILLDLNDTYPLKDVHAEIERFCSENGIPVHSLLPSFLGHDATSLWISPYDQHPNARAQAIAADGMYPFVEEHVRSGAESKP